MYIYILNVRLLPFVVGGNISVLCMNIKKVKPVASEMEEKLFTQSRVFIFAIIKERKNKRHTNTTRDRENDYKKKGGKSINGE